MNKIYLEPIVKAQMLIDGVNKQSELLAKNGIAINVEQLKQLCDEMEMAGRIQDEAERQLKQLREKAHTSLNALKELYTASKLPIKQTFPQETWLSFGLIDKK